MIAGRIHGHFLSEISSFLTHEQVLVLSLHGLNEVRYDHAGHPHLDSDTSRIKTKNNKQL